MPMLICACAVSTACGGEISPQESISGWKFSLGLERNNAPRLVTQVILLEPGQQPEYSAAQLQQPRVYGDERLLFLRLKRQAGDGSLAFSNFQFGYGDVIDYTPPLIACSNGAAFETPSCFFVKYNMRF